MTLSRLDVLLLMRHLSELTQAVVLMPFMISYFNRLLYWRCDKVKPTTCIQVYCTSSLLSALAQQDL